MAQCVRLTALREINNKALRPSAAEIDLVNDQGQVLDHTGWTIKAVDSQELVGENGAAANAIDGNDGTIWHTQWSAASPTPPHYIDIDLGSEQTLAAVLQYLPRQDGGINGTIADYQVFVSPQCTATWTLVANGTWNTTTTRKTATFDPAVNIAPTVSISSPATGSMTAGDAATFTGSATDPEDGDISAGLAWTSDVAGPLGNGASITVTLPPGPHTITATVTDADGAAASVSIQINVVTPGTSGVVAQCVRLTALREINNRAYASAAEIDLVNDQGQVLDQTGWTIKAVDSQELVGEDGAAAPSTATTAPSGTRNGSAPARHHRITSTSISAASRHWPRSSVSATPRRRHQRHDRRLSGVREPTMHRNVDPRRRRHLEQHHHPQDRHL